MAIWNAYAEDLKKKISDHQEELAEFQIKES
jgi:hypothetical protein